MLNGSARIGVPTSDEERSIKAGSSRGCSVGDSVGKLGDFRLKMTQKEALKEARRRWGKGALISYKSTWKMPYAVGRSMIFAFEVLGQGRTWEDAFKNHDERDKRFRALV